MSILILPSSQISRIYPLAAAFLAEMRHPDPFNPKSFGKFWATLYSADMGRILVAEQEGEIRGMLGFSWHPDAFTGATVLHEQMWWVFPEHRASGIGLDLISAFEGQAQKRGATWVFLCNLVSLEAERMDRLYTRRGYVQTERVYWRKV